MAPDFTLTDHLGNPISLGDFRGKTVVLTFLYTHCTTACPLITSKFVGIEKTYRESLGEDVIFIAVNVDPHRDTPERIGEYLEAYGFKGYFLTGSSEEVASVWEEYGVYVEYVEIGENETRSSTNLLGGEGEYEVIHTVQVILIDKEGRMRVVHLGVEWEDEYLAQDIVILRDE
ncbi:MAG: SCO family protein [Candidatus Geothermarchaeales archaeon]